MEARLRRAEERSEDPGITAWNISHTLHAPGLLLWLLVLLQDKELSHPCLCVEWGSVTAGLGDLGHVGHPSAFLGNYCSRVEPNMLRSLPGMT